VRHRTLVFGKVNIAFARSVGAGGDNAHVHSGFDFREQQLPIVKPCESFAIPQQ
jgi:hypothetical protein